jgi:hypothetical protein
VEAWDDVEDDEAAMLEADELDEAAPAKGAVDETSTPLWLSCAIGVLASCTSMRIQEEESLHMIQRKFPRSSHLCLAELLKRQLRSSSRQQGDPSAFARMARAFLHAEMLTSPRLRPDVLLLVSCPQSCMHLGDEPPHVHELPTASSIIATIPVLKRRALEEALATTAADADGLVTTRIPCQDVAFETADYALSLARFGRAPPGM